MRVLCCPAAYGPERPRPETVESLRLYAPDAEIVDVTHDPLGYYREIYSRWNGDDDLVIVEHDIKFSGEDLQSFEECPEQWCLFGYLYLRQDTRLIFDHSIGFVRFRKELMAAACLPAQPVLWSYVDGHLQSAASGAGFERHFHGVVEHFHIPDPQRHYYRTESIISPPAAYLSKRGQQVRKRRNV